jgi:hypothetical protein
MTNNVILQNSYIKTCTKLKQSVEKAILIAKKWHCSKLSFNFVKIEYYGSLETVETVSNFLLSPN